MTKQEISIGKYRGLQQIATESGMFTMLALDHQESFRKGINTAAPDTVPYNVAVEAKMDIVSSLAKHASALLTDLRYGAAQSIGSGSLLGRTGLLITLEQSPGHGPNETIAMKTWLVKGWNVAKVRCMGASAVKLLVYYHPKSAAASAQEALVSQVAAECKEHDIPLVLEVLTHPAVEGQKKDSAEFAADKAFAVIESARRLCPLGADVFKGEFPVNMKFEKDEKKMLKLCQELTDAAKIPWVVLSAAVSHDDFCRQVQISCEGGASGFLAGRSIWGDALAMPGADRRAFLSKEGVRRLAELTAITEKAAHPFTEYYQSTVNEGWYERY